LSFQTPRSDNKYNWPADQPDIAVRQSIREETVVARRKQDSSAIRQATASSGGRPASGENRNVQEDIVRAAKACLIGKSSQQITTKEIAAQAGTRSAMIYYYFGSKDGLLAEILRRELNEILDGLRSMQEAIRSRQVSNPTRAMVAMFAASFNLHPLLRRILIPEMLRENSQITSYFMEQWRPALGNKILVEIITELCEAGHYRKNINVEGITKMIRSVVFFPMINEPYRELEGKTTDNGLASELDDEWIDFVATVLDSYLLPKK
jgi:TetR/AcrR family transcriptional regulator